MASTLQKSKQQIKIHFINFKFCSQVSVLYIKKSSYITVPHAKKQVRKGYYKSNIYLQNFLERSSDKNELCFKKNHIASSPDRLIRKGYLNQNQFSSSINWGWRDVYFVF